MGNCIPRLFLSSPVFCVIAACVVFSWPFAAAWVAPAPVVWKELYAYYYFICIVWCEKVLTYPAASGV